MNIRSAIFAFLLCSLAAGYFFFAGSFGDKASTPIAAAPPRPTPISPPTIIASPKPLAAPVVTKADITRARRVYFLRQLPSEEAVVLNDTTDGVTTTSASPDYWQLTTTPEKLAFLSDQISTNGALSSADILALFQNEKDAAVREQLLGYATLPDYDANIQAVFALALRPDQPADLRLAALAYAVDGDPSIAATFQNDASPDLRLEAQGLVNARPASQAQPMSN